MSFRLFSSPAEGDFVSFAERFSYRFLRETIRMVNAQADERGAPRLSFDDDATVPARLSTRTWRPELGVVMLGLHRGVTEADWPWVWGQMQVGAFLSDLIPGLDLEIRGRYPLVVSGHLVQGDRLVVRGDQDRLEIRGDSGETLLQLSKVALPGIAPVWARDPDADVVRLGSGSIALVCDGRWVVAWYPTLPPPELSPDPATCRRTLERAMAHIEEHLPLQYLWICFVLREVTLLRDMGPETTASQSFMTWPGYVQLSQSTVLQNIIMLLHECSHQYFHMLMWSGSPVKTDSPEAYSALKGTKRPFEKILLGYHAFANVLLTLAELRRLDTGLDPHELARQIRSTGHLVSDLDAELDPCWEQFLEERGKAIYLPLRQRIAAAVKLPPPSHTRDLSMVHD